MNKDAQYLKLLTQLEEGEQDKLTEFLEKLEKSERRYFPSFIGKMAESDIKSNDSVGLTFLKSVVKKYKNSGFDTAYKFCMSNGLDPKDEAVSHFFGDDGPVDKTLGEVNTFLQGIAKNLEEKDLERHSMVYVISGGLLGKKGFLARVWNRIKALCTRNKTTSKE